MPKRRPKSMKIDPNITLACKSQVVAPRGPKWCVVTKLRGPEWDRNGDQSGTALEVMSLTGSGQRWDHLCCSCEQQSLIVQY